MLGKRLVSAEKLIHARVGLLLDSMITKIDSEIHNAISPAKSALKVYASHGFSIEALNKQLHKREIAIDLGNRGYLKALNAVEKRL